MLSDYTLETMVKQWRQYQKKSQRPWHGVVFGLLLLGAVLVSLRFFDDFTLIETLSLPLGIGLILIGLVIFLINRRYVRGKVSVETLFRALIEDSHQENTRRYHAYPKAFNHVHKEGGLFNRHAFARVRYAIEGTTDDGTPFTLMNLSLIVSTGSASSEIFRGIYLTLPYDAATRFQIKTRYRPSLKGVKFEKVGESTPFKLYQDVETEDPQTSLNAWLLEAKNLHKDLKAKHSYLGFNGNALHYAFSSKAVPYKLTTGRPEELRKIYQTLSDYLALPDRIKTRT